MSFPCPYKPITPIPSIQYEKFDGANFAYMTWPCSDAEVKGRILIVHGFNEHCSLQYRLMDNLSQNGYESFMFDQRGAGMTSPGKLKGLTDEYHTFNDLDHFIEKNLKECKQKKIPLILFGHSMGGAIVLSYACHGKYKHEIDAYTCTGPLIQLHPHSKPSMITQLLSPLLARFLPKVRIDTGLDLQGITSDIDYRNYLANDKPLSVPIIGSFKQIYDFLQRGDALYLNKDGYVTKNFVQDKPVLIMHGQMDTINDPDASKKFIEICPAKDKELKLYPGARHSILSLESDKYFKPIFADYVEWLDNHST